MAELNVLNMEAVKEPARVEQQRINTQNIPPQSIKQRNLGDNSVGEDQLQADSVGSSQIQDGVTLVKPAVDATNPSAQTYAPAAAGTATLDLSLANEHRITMPAGNITIALTGDTNAQKFIVSITQDSVGSRTVTWFTTIRWHGSAPTLTTTANKRDTFGFIRTGTSTYDGFIVGQNA